MIANVSIHITNILAEVITINHIHFGANDVELHTLARSFLSLGPLRLVELVLLSLLIQVLLSLNVLPLLVHFVVHVPVELFVVVPAVAALFHADETL